MKKPVVRIFYKSSNKGPYQSPYHAGGLAANALHTVGVLKELGVDCEAVAVRGYEDLFNYLAYVADDSTTHAIIEAVWLTVNQADALARAWPHTKFVVRAHSKIGFLQVEPQAIAVMRAIADTEVSNLHLASNNAEFAGAFGYAYGPTLYLPNLYDLASAPGWQGGMTGLHVGSFGASRLLKMHCAAALAAVQAATFVQLPLHFYINVDQTPGGDSVRRTVREIVKGKGELVEVGWQDTETFKRTIASMDVVLQLSATETFCLVAADAVASGVPVVVGPAITWVPKKYQAPIDDTTDVARVLERVLGDRKAAVHQKLALMEYVADSVDVWLKWLGFKRHKGWWT